MTNDISLGSMDISRRIAQNIKFGSKRKVSIMLMYVLNQTQLKFPIILGGLILDVRLTFLI